MRRAIMSVLAVLVLAVPVAQADYRRIELTVFGMD